MRMSDSDRPTACDDRLEETGSSASRFAGINQADGLESMPAGSEWGDGKNGNNGRDAKHGKDASW